MNDYLAQRDAENNRPSAIRIFGMSVGINLLCMPAPAKREAYAADITYGTNNNEYGFDYLRDNMARSARKSAQQPHYALVDEADSS